MEWLNNLYFNWYSVFSRSVFGGFSQELIFFVLNATIPTLNSQSEFLL